MCHYISLQEEQAGRQRGLRRGRGNRLKRYSQIQKYPSSTVRREHKIREQRRHFLREIKPGVFSNAWTQLLQMGLSANKRIIVFLFFLEKTHPSCYTRPTPVLDMLQDCGNTASLSQPVDLSGGEPAQGITARPGRAPASGYLPHGAVPLPGQLVPATESKDRDKELVTPWRLLFQSSFALQAVTSARPDVPQKRLLSPHRPFPSFVSLLLSYVMLHTAAAVSPVFPVPLTLSHVPCSLQHPNALHVSYLIFLACQLGRRAQMLVQK